MFRRLSILFVVFASLVLGTYADPQPSQGPGCSAICPSQDTGGFPLGQSDLTVNPIFCSYPAVPGEDPQDFYCTYGKTTGALVADNDAGFCPATATLNCPTRRKRNAFPKSPRSPDPGPKPDIMKVRRKLGMAKRREN